MHITDQLSRQEQIESLQPSKSKNSKSIWIDEIEPKNKKKSLNYVSIFML